MDELTAVREFAPDTPLPDAADLAAVRARLMTEIRPRRRFRVAGWSTAGIAAAAATVLIATALNGGGQPPSTPQVADAAQVLHEAADAARRAPDVAPLPDQFVYVRLAGPQGDDQELWLSVDGTRDGLSGGSVLPGCRDGRAVTVPAEGGKAAQTTACTPEPAYLPELPTDVDRMVAYLTGNGHENLNWSAKRAYMLLSVRYLHPGAKAALFEALTRIDGLHVDNDAHTPGGRKGVGIWWEYGGGRTEMVFDPKSHVFLGTTNEALAAMKIVDRVGQR